MRDSELVLRFIAYNKRVEEYRGNFKEFLDEIVEFYEKGWLNYQQEVVDALNSLNLALDTTVQIFGDNSFKNGLEQNTKE